MPINNDSLNKQLFYLLKTQGFEPAPKDSTGKAIPVPDLAEVFKFTYKKNDEPIAAAWITVEGGNTLKVYYDDKLVDDQNNGFITFLKHLKKWAQRRQLGFELENEDHLSSDMAQRDYMKNKENISEGYYPMGKTSSYNDSVPTIKIVLQHTRQIQEGEQRFRNVARIYLENVQGERILAPTTRPGIAQVYARHLAEGGVPNDERWNHIKSLCEEYTKMAGFVRAVRGNQFNESAQRLVEAGLNHYTSLRESLGKMRGHRGYNAYFESWTPTLMETEGDETNLNELFVQETLDPRIESVMPILSKLKVDLSEMKEVNELAEWADKVLEDESLTSDNPQGIPESEDAEAAHKKTQIPAFKRKASGDPDWKTTPQDLAKAKERNISGSEGLAALTKRLQDIGQMDEEEIDEAYINKTQDAVNVLANLRKISKGIETGTPYQGNLANMYANDVWDVYSWLQNRANVRDPKLSQILNSVFDVRKQAKALEREPDSGSNTQLANQIVNALYPLIQWIEMNVRDNQQGVAEDLDANQKRVGQLGPTEKITKSNPTRGKLVGASESVEDVTEEYDEKRIAGQVLEKLISLARDNPNTTMAELASSPLKNRVKAAISACDSLIKIYTDDKQLGNAEFVRQLKAEINHFLTDVTPSQDPMTLGDLLMGKLGKITFQKGVAEGSPRKPLDNKQGRAAIGDWERVIAEPESPEHQAATKQRIKTAPMAGPKGKLPEQGVAEGQGSLQSWVNQDQAERNEYAQFVKSKAGGDWNKGAKMYAQLKKRPSNDIFGDTERLNQFIETKFDFTKFTNDDWDNYWLLAQHCDRNRNFQKQALATIAKYQGTDHSHYKYLYDRISCGTTGQQKYGTQDGCDKDRQGVAEGLEDSNTWKVYINKAEWKDFTKWMDSEGLVYGAEDGVGVRDLGKQIELTYPKNMWTDYNYASDWDQGVAEGLNEMDSEGYKGHRGDEDVKEGQEDLIRLRNLIKNENI